MPKDFICRRRRLIPLFFLCLLFFDAVTANAEITDHRLKFVFPFGTVRPRICDPQYQTTSGCCDKNPTEMYTWSGVKGCCRSPNQLSDGKCCSSCDGTWLSPTDVTCGSCCPQWYPAPELCCTKGADWITENINGIDYSRCCPTHTPRALSSVFALKGKNFHVQGCCSSAQYLYAAPRSISYVGGTTSLNYINWSTGCCSHLPTSTALGGYQCCSNASSPFAHYTYLYNYLPQGTRYEEYLNAGCCTASSPNLVNFGNNQTICCPAGVDGYRYSVVYYWSLPYYYSYTTGCCTADRPQQRKFKNGTICCAADETVTEFMDYSYRGTVWGNNTLQTGYSPSCCPAAHVRQTAANGTLCCSPGVDHYAFLSTQTLHNTGRSYRGGCCTTSSPKAVSVGTIGTYCCPEGVSAAINLDNVGYFLSNVNDFARVWKPKCCTSSSPVPTALKNPKDSHNLGQLCCPADASTYTFMYRYKSTYATVQQRNMLYSFGCCGAGETPQQLPDTRGTYCCPNNSSAYTYIHSWSITNNIYREAYNFYSAGCCTAASPYLVQTVTKNQTICCPTSHAAFLSATETFLTNATVSTRSYTISCCGNGEIAKSVMNGTQCCPSDLSAFGFKHSLSYFDTNVLAEYKMSTGCCTAASPALVSIPGGWGTFCCPAGQKASTSTGYANSSRLRWIYPVCQ